MSVRADRLAKVGLRPGFTLLELASVLAIIGILVGIGVTGYGVYRKKAMTAEAVVNVQTIANLQRGRIAGPIACAPSPATVPSLQAAPWESSEGFRALGYRPGPMTRFQYEVALIGDETEAERGYVIRARGDLDGDGETSLFEMRSDEVDVRAEREVE